MTGAYVQWHRLRIRWAFTKNRLYNAWIVLRHGLEAPDMTKHDDDLRDAVWAELLDRYDEGESTDWQWFTDLVEVVVELIDRYGIDRYGSA